MSTTSVSPAQRLYIAIAIAALKCKPPDLSIRTYVLELQRRFPNPAKSTTEECDAWRERTLQLEAEMHAARTATITEAIEFILRKPSPPSAENDATEPTPPASKRGRKKTKKSQKKSDLAERRTQAAETSSTTMERFRKGEVAPSGNEALKSSLGTNRGIFSSLHSLDDIAAQFSTKSTSPLDATRVVAASLRCIDVSRALLNGVTSTVSAAPIPEDATPQDAIDAIQHIIQNILRTVIPALQGAYIDTSNIDRLRWHDIPSSDELVYPFQMTSAPDLVLLRIMTGVLMPAIHAFAPCTLAKTEQLLSDLGPKPPKRELADGAQLLSLISAILGALLPDRQYIALYDCVVREAVRELTSLITDLPSRLTHARLTPTQRIRRIATKDALHFLCDVSLLALHRSAVASSPPLPESRENGLLRAALAEALGDLALTQSVREGVGSGLDVVEEQRVMAVLERAWSVGLRVGHIGGDVEGETMDVSYDDVLEQDGDVVMMDVNRGTKEYQL